MDRTNANYEVMSDEAGRPIKTWTVGVPFEDEAKKQLRNLRGLPFIHKWIAAMPDVHRGYGATVGSVVPTVGAVVPAAVGVDIGCGMIAVRTTLRADQLPDSLRGVRSAIEAAVPHGRTDNGGRNDRGAWKDSPATHTGAWARLAEGYARIVAKHPRIGRGPELAHLGTLGTGNHFIELCVDESDGVWLMLHSGSRGVGNRIGSHFIELAKQDMERFFIRLPDADLAYLPEGTEHFDDYVFAVSWAQDFAAMNRELMLHSAVEALKASGELPPFELSESAVNCHHNYISREHHFGKNCFVTRKGAVRAREGDMGIIPGSMGARSYIVRGKGNADAFHSCSHGAGRAMSREAAKKRFTLDDHAKATAGVECRKDVDVIDETPAAYKSIDAVMAAQADLVEVVHTLKQVVCVKG
ncbi:RtcB family protein [Corallococcus exiguus]|uniref:RtcB family protein n=1 Tax=Corallococcus TaxID=83461 RepID=UPI000EA3BAA2|nr:MULTISPECIES: RtcB family protein [Corallococcus]NNC19163.1 RtcB family protein [Corallococcus exiguus]RKH23510.1 RtcB family protein [Corallococcus sp. CA041A]RKI10338.1 RtcB family protein [Corallococcus sp. AB030]RUO90239.1 RtcB family protein [Corallococcus sp. AB018]